MSTAVSFDNVSRRYGDITALAGVSFNVASGSVYGVVGTSGAGKSTLLRTVNGLETPSEGSVTVLDQDPATLSQAGLRGLRREVSMIFQHYNLLGSKTVAENVAMPLMLSGTPKDTIRGRVAEALERVSLAAAALRRAAPAGGHRPRAGDPSEGSAVR